MARSNRATPEEIDALRAGADSASTETLARFLGLPRHTLERAMAALPLRDGTLLRLRAAMAAKGVHVAPREGEAP